MNIANHKNLVANAKWAGDNELKDWSLFSPRPVLAPGHAWQRGGTGGNATLLLQATGDDRIFGGWRGRAEMQAGKWYKASVGVRIKDIPEPDLSILAMAGNHLLLPQGPWREETILQREFPKGTGQFETNHIDLFLRSTPCGQVHWYDPCVVEIDKPPQRKARVATVRFGTTDQKVTLEFQRRRIAEKLDQAGALEPDVTLLTEFSSVEGIPSEDFRSYTDFAEPVPAGPTCQVFAATARKYHMYVIGGLIERRGDYVYNTAVIFDRHGALVGQYDKTHLTLVELLEGFTCGRAYPLFELDFGKIAIHICYDEWFPEVSRYYASQGAEILFLPVMGGKPLTWRTRALDNGIYFVASSHTPPSMIIDSTGAILAETHGEGIAYADLNLDYRQTNVYLDPTLAYGMPAVIPQLRHVVDDQLLELLYRPMRQGR